jgi:hypothetical protein
VAADAPKPKTTTKLRPEDDDQAAAIEVENVRQGLKKQRKNGKKNHRR